LSYVLYFLSCQSFGGIDTIAI